MIEKTGVIRGLDLPEKAEYTNEREKGENKEYLMNKKIMFRYIYSAFPRLYCLKFSFKSVDISKSYAK